MSDAKPDSSRNLLAEIEGDWETAKPAPVAAKAQPAPSPLPSEQELHDELDAAADRLVDSLDPPPVSAANLSELDSGWGDDEDDEDDDAGADDEANEPALPDERLDPVAYAAAKQARDERIEARRERRRMKAEAKKARRRARADAQRSKQKGKQRKARPPQPARPERKAKSRPVTRADDDGANAREDEQAIAPSRARAKTHASSSPSKPMLSKTNQWMLAVAVIVFVAAAIFAAVVAR